MSRVCIANPEGYEEECFQIQEFATKTIPFAWTNMRKIQPQLPELKEAAKTLDCSGYFFEHLEHLKNWEGFPPPAFDGLWAQVQLAFSLRETDQLIEESRVRKMLLRTVIWASRCPPIYERTEELKAISYGWFCSKEMGWLLANFPKLIEIGAGKGYFAHKFRSKGGNIIAIDRYNFKELSPEQQLPEFTLELMNHKRLIIGGVEQLTPKRMKGRAALMVCPAPCSSMPLEVIKAFTGDILIMKMGIFTKLPREISDTQHPQNVVEFFQILAREWQVISEKDDPDRPRWKWNELGGNPLVFKRRR